jgi:hypothetical protein
VQVGMLVQIVSSFVSSNSISLEGQ